MCEQDKDRVSNALNAIPNPEEIRLRIAENIQEREILRQMLKLSEQRDSVSSLRNQRGANE